jgi:hypothetical protein
MRRTGVDAQLGLPFARQRYARLVPEKKVQILRLAQEPSLGPGLQNTNGEDVFPRLQRIFTETVNSWILDPGAAADELSVDVHRVHTVDDPEKHHGAVGSAAGLLCGAR